MRKSDLVAQLKKRHPRSSSGDIEKVVETILDSIGSSLAAGGRIELRGFGVFAVKVRAERTGRDPRTGRSITINRKRHVSFRTARDLQKRMNGHISEPTFAQSITTQQNQIVETFDP